MVNGGAVIDELSAHGLVSAGVSSGLLYGYFQSGGSGGVLCVVSGASNLSCTVTPDAGSGTDITFVATGGDAILHAAAGFEATPAANTHGYRFQSARSELQAGAPGPNTHLHT